VSQQKTIEQLAIDTIRVLAIDSIDKANSGHPGMPMGAAPMGYQLFAKSMKHNPANPSWINRDRFVLSAGHGSMLLYSLLHLSGYGLTIADLQQFRQWGSLTPGHPEFGHTLGVEATTGPLGQGISMAVGMAMAEAHLSATYNRPNYDVIDHYTYAICGDGDLMEGVSHETAALAGHLQLGKLIVLHDSNSISLDGGLDLSTSEDVNKRFEAYGWQVLRVEDGNDLTAIGAAIKKAQAQVGQPTLIEVRTVLGYGSPNKGGKGGHGGTHGSPLGADETKLTKEFYGWEATEAFTVPAEVRAHFAELGIHGSQVNADWDVLFEAYAAQYPELAAELTRAMRDELPAGWDAELPWYGEGDKAISTRVASGKAMNAIAATVPSFIGGSADLESSNMTHLDGYTQFRPGSYEGRNIYYGVREFAMAAASNGMSLHGGLRPFCATFFVFVDYLRPAVRLSALMQRPVVYVLTHDSIAVGEDGPTHEPIEQLASLRAIPHVTVIRPADANETTAAWLYAMENQGDPVVLVLSRQNLPILAGTQELARKGVQQGAYVVFDGAQNAEDIQAQIIATGSEVSLAIAAAQELAKEGIKVRVISMPSWELFERQSKASRDAVLLPNVKARLAVEMASPFGWERYVGDQGAILGIDTFGASAPGPRVIEEYGFTTANVVNQVKALL
jgi:transketolase